jgi:Nucleotidyltransferase domain
MGDLALTFSTGSQPIDITLLAIVRAFEHAFPNRVRAYYLIGSYVEGTAVPLSDIDCFVIFADQFATSQEQVLAQQVGQQCAEASPVRLDIGAYPENALGQLYPVLRAALKLGSALVYGVDIRQTMQLPALPEYTASVIAGARQFIARLRGETNLRTPQVSYPDRLDEFFGYARKSIPAWYPPTIAAGTKELVATVSRIATAQVVRQTQRYVPGKQQAIELFQQEVGGTGARFVEQVFRRCKLDWKYLVPETERERIVLRELCQQMLGFENEFLRTCQQHDVE